MEGTYHLNEGLIIEGKGRIITLRLTSTNSNLEQAIFEEREGDTTKTLAMKANGPLVAIRDNYLAPVSVSEGLCTINLFLAQGYSATDASWVKGQPRPGTKEYDLLRK